MNLASLFSNPLVKTIGSTVAGAAVVGIDNALQAPTGGMLAALSTQPAYAAAFTIGALLFHNWASSLTFLKAPAATAPPK